MKQDTTLALALELGRAMTEMKNYLRRNIQSRIRESKMDISFEMLEIMACLWTKDSIKQQEIADLTNKDKSSMTYLIDNLVKRNMVSREADPEDRRNNLICLTREGKQLQKKLHPWLVEMYSVAATGISPADLRRSLQLIRIMNKNLSEKILIN